MERRTRKWYFMFYFWLLISDLGICNNIRHHREKGNIKPLRNNTKATERMIDDGAFQQDPPDSEDDDTTPPFVFMTISEINMDSPSTVPKRFVEIHVDNNPVRTPPPFKNKLTGWRLILLKGTTMEMTMSIDLSAQIFEFSGSKIVVGDQSVPNVNIVLQNEKTETCKDECIIDLDTSPYAIILVVSMNAVTHDLFSLPKEGRKFQSVNLLHDEIKQQMFFKYTWDVAVIGRKVATNQCDFFTNLFPAQSFNSDFKYLLRDRDYQAQATSVGDYSLNFCCNSFIPYSPECFKLGHPSPGAENDCTGRRFIVERLLNTVQTARMSTIFVDMNAPLCKADFSGVPPYRYAAVHDHDYAAAVARVMQSSSSCSTSDVFVDIDPIENEGPLFRSLMEIDESIPEEPKMYIDAFDPESFRDCRQHFSKPDDLLESQFTSWIELAPPDCNITCRMCRSYFKDGWRPDKKNRVYLHEVGYVPRKSKYTNQKALVDHLTDDIHLEAAHFYQSLASAETRQEQLNLERLQRLDEEKRLRPTMNEVQLAYAELRARVSFRSHKIFMDSASQLNVNVGFKHRHAEALKKISSTLSSSFHRKLLTCLIKSNQFFSLICDGTTNRNVPYLVCLIQTIEESRPIVYFWGLIVITTGETGYSMVEDLKIRILEDDEEVPGFQDFFKKRIIALVTDSASNMVGKTNSFYTHLNEYLDRNITLVKCGAHKLQRAILHAIDFPTDDPSTKKEDRERDRYFKSFAKVNNQFYSFYMSRGSKRFQEFVELAEELDLHSYRIHYFFDVRWAASHQRCMETMYRNFDALYADLSRITGDADFDEAGKTKANELYKNLKDKTFAVVMAEFVDMLAVFKSMSVRFQSKGGIMAGNVEIIRDGYRDLQFLQTHPGAILKDFLLKCSCEGICLEGECTLNQYDRCPEVKRKPNQTLRLRDDGTHTILLSEFRSRLYENLMQQVVEYFDPAVLEAFEVFNPKNFVGLCHRAQLDSESESGLEAYYLEFQSIVPNAPRKSAAQRLQKLCSFYDLTNCDELETQWKEFVRLLTRNSAVMKLREYDPANFWSTVLMLKDVKMSPVVKDIVSRVLSTSFTSADAERAFSMVSNIKTPDRSSLSPSNLENLVRIAFNGPDTLSRESIFEYTKDFVKISSRVDDPSTVGGRPAKPEAYKSYFSKSRIF